MVEVQAVSLNNTSTFVLPEAPKDRQMAMVLLDAVFHDEGAPQQYDYTDVIRQ